MTPTTRSKLVSQIAWLAFHVVAACSFELATATAFQSHAPVRPLPQASTRPFTSGPTYFVSGIDGNDDDAGTKESPWRTIASAVKKLQPGDTLVLRSGVYHEHVSTTLIGTAEKPITIRAYPNELVTIDGGLPEFLHSPQSAWELAPNGAAGEFRSTRIYPDIEETQSQLRVSLLGLFADSLLPLHGYWHHPDLQSDNPYWNIGGEGKTKPDAHVYCGPGLWYDTETERIHCRLAHTKLPGLHDNNYRGETDPRKLPLVVAGWRHGPVMKLTDCRYVRLQDLVLRGARQHTLDIRGGGNIELDGFTLYGGQSCLMAEGIVGLRVAHTAFRGLAAPWTFRGSLKYRSIESRLVRTGGWDSDGASGSNYEFAYCEFTDSVDGVFVGGIRRVRFHHNLVENISDDAIFVTANTGFDGETHGGDSHFYQNRFARNLTCFAFGVGHGRQKTIETGKQLGGGLWIYRNVFDFRAPVMYRWPSGPDDEQELDSIGRFGGDHGSPAWEPMWIYHNTFLTGEPSRFEYAGTGISAPVSKGTSRRVFNNIVCQKTGAVKDGLPSPSVDFAADGNLIWSVTDGASTTATWCRKFRTSPDYEASKQQYAPGWTTNDQFADPQFVAYESNGWHPADVRLTEGSPAIDAGVALPRQWADPLRSVDKTRADRGALPHDMTAWRIGCQGRIDVCDHATANAAGDITLRWDLPLVADADLPRHFDKPAAIICGYPAFDAPLIEFAMRKRGVQVDVMERTWLDPREYSRYGAVILDGSFTRAKITPDRFSATDLAELQRYLKGGGVVWLCRERHDLFAAAAGKEWLASLGIARASKGGSMSLLKPQHPWVRHLTPDAELPWLGKATSPLQVNQGENLLGDSADRAALVQIAAGHGRLIYLGWSPAADLPSGRSQVTTDDEARFAEQMQIITNIATDLYPTE